MVGEALALLPPQRGPLFLILDADHSRDHVLAELRAWVPRLRAGDYLIVEDTVVNGHPVRADHGPGPWEAVADFLREAPGALTHDARRERKFGSTFAAHGHFVRT
jgi:cephalosporin hydroxylase